jgi:methionyl-tRNA synthetase
MINYEQFAALDIRIGEIRAVDIVENADKLLRLTVDVGETEDDGVTPRPRQIISGIRTFFDDPQALVGIRCPFIINLEPRTIRGLESQGMILAAGDEQAFSLLVSTNVPPGTKVR